MKLAPFRKLPKTEDLIVKYGTPGAFVWVKPTAYSVSRVSMVPPPGISISLHPELIK